MTDLEFSEIKKEDHGAYNQGRMKLTEQGIIFKSSKTGKVEQISKNDIRDTQWQRLPTSYMLRIMTTAGLLYRYIGFSESDHEKLEKFVKSTYGLSMKTKEISVKGWNWGTANFNGSVLSFDNDNKAAFEIPLTYVSHCTSSKNEVTLEFHQNDAAPISLMELRFHLPNQYEGVDDNVKAFTDNVLSKANIIQATGDAIATFSELQCLTPRGRYDIKIFPSFIQLHGKTFDYKIPVTTILRLFRLPDKGQTYFVLSMDPPITQGMTRYHFLILLFNKDDQISLELGLSEREIENKFKDKLEKNMSGLTVDVLGQLMKAVVQRKINVPAQVSGNHNAAIKCSYRAGAGLLYPLERGFIYVHKPPVHIRFDEILSTNFARSGGSTKSFDFEVETRSGVVHTFSSIEKDEYAKFYDFVSSKKLRVKNRGNDPVKTGPDDDLVDSDNEDEHDAYLARVKHEGKIRAEEGGGDDSDESDDSFNPETGAGSGSDVAEEYDSNASFSDSSDSDASGGDGSKKKEKKREKEKNRDKGREKKKAKKKSDDKPKRESKKKAADDGRPKKPMSAYFLWMEENRPKIKKGNMSVTDIAKKAGEIWRGLTPADKTKYEEKAAQLKVEYNKLMTEYNKTAGSNKGPVTPSKSGKSPKKSASTPTKSSSLFKSKEYISDSDSSGSSGSEKRPAKKIKKEASDDEDNRKKNSTKDSASESEDAMSSAASESVGSGSGSDSE